MVSHASPPYKGGDTRGNFNGSTAAFKQETSRCLKWISTCFWPCGLLCCGGVEAFTITATPFLCLISRILLSDRTPGNLRLAESHTKTKGRRVAHSRKLKTKQRKFISQPVKEVHLSRQSKSQLPSSKSHVLLYVSFLQQFRIRWKSEGDHQALGSPERHWRCLYPIWCKSPKRSNDKLCMFLQRVHRDAKTPAGVSLSKRLNLAAIPLMMRAKRQMRGRIAYGSLILFLKHTQDKTLRTTLPRTCKLMFD